MSARAKRRPIPPVSAAARLPETTVRRMALTLAHHAGRHTDDTLRLAAALAPAVDVIGAGYIRMAIEAGHSLAPRDIISAAERLKAFVDGGPTGRRRVASQPRVLKVRTQAEYDRARAGKAGRP